MEIHGFKVRTAKADMGLTDWVIVRLWGEIKGQEFFCDVSFEVDGRDAEIEPLWGPNPQDLEFDFFDLLYQSEKWPEVNKKFQEVHPH